MAGFYVTLDSEGDSPLYSSNVSAETIDEDLQTAAQAIEILLIKDHNRMRLEATTPYDSTDEQQLRLLSIAYPKDWDASVS